MEVKPINEPGEVQRIGRSFAEAIGTALQVPASVTRDLVVALLAEGHVLIEDHPGVGKTALARALARTIDAGFSRIQCTVDLLPADVIGTMVYDQRQGAFEFHPGPVFANVVLVDEINRASPKTQSGLLEAMQERGVTVEGTTHHLAAPFVVIATQNPSEFAGTFPLPEAQLDRFMVRLELGYPEPAREAAMLEAHAAGDRVAEVEPVLSLEQVLAAQRTVAEVHGSDAVRRYIVALAAATRADPRTELGASPRAALMLYKAAKAAAALAGRSHVTPDDVQALAHSVLSHRLLLAAGATAEMRAEVVSAAIESTPAR
ncbi:MAG: AAA family ATPase [Solirubrobacterales bacterium]